MKRKTTLFLALCMLISLISGCGRESADGPGGAAEVTPEVTQDGGGSAGDAGEDIGKDAGEDAGEDTGEDAGGDPFDYEGPSEILGSVSHLGDWPEREEGKPLEYTGGELEVPYSANGSGTGKNVGFLLFIDGNPQPYKLNGEGEYAYIHPFSLKKDYEWEHFTFNFVPVAGEAGDELIFTVVNIFNAEFEPDMINTSSFGMYGEAVYAVNYIHFSVSPTEDAPKARQADAVANVSVSNDLITKEFEETRLSNYLSGGDRTLDDVLSSDVYCFDTYDGTVEYNSIDLTGRASVHAALDLCGVPGLTYRISLFADGVPLSDGDHSVWEVTLEKGKAARVEADLLTDRLPEAVTTFYFTACLVDGGSELDKWTRRNGFIKTDSLPLWDGGKLNADDILPGESGQNGVGSDQDDTPSLNVSEAVDGPVRPLRYGGNGTAHIRKADRLRLTRFPHSCLCEARIWS